MAKKRPAWLSIVPPGVAAKLSLDELRAFKGTHTFLTEPIAGPEGLAYHVRGYRYLLFFAAGCMANDSHPALNRCWKELERLFLREPLFSNDLFVQSWILFDFPVGPKGETMLDYFEEFLTGSEGAERLQYFIDEARKSRLGLYQDVGRTKAVSKFRELFTKNVVSAVRSVEDYENGEIFLTRMIEYRGEVFLFGDPKCWPAGMRGQLEDMVADKMLDVLDGLAEVVADPYPRFMKLAGPYWMSCVTKNEAVPILPPDHYRSYL